MDKWNKSEHMDYLCTLGLYEWRGCSDNPKPHYCAATKVQMWGIDMWSKGERPNTKYEVAIHECGHAVAIMALGMEFEYIKLGGKPGVLGGVIAALETEDPVVKAAGPLATSYEKRGNWTTWQQCWDDVSFLALLEREGEDVLAAISEAQEILTESWGVVEKMLTRLLNNGKLSFEQCRIYLPDSAD